MTDSRQELKAALEQLKAELDASAPGDPAKRAKLDQLIRAIEQKIESPDDGESHQSLVERAREAVAQFETSHPRATAILNDIMVTLGNMGI